MNIDLNDAQKKKLVEILAIAFQVEFLKGCDNSDIEELIHKIADSLKSEGKMHIFTSVFMGVGKV